VLDEAREEGSEHAPSSERWLLTYADMITLLMVFFIVIYSFSKTDEAKYQAIALSLHAALSGAALTRGLPNDATNAMVPLSPQPTTDQALGPQPANTLLQTMAQKIAQSLQTQSQQGEATVQVVTGTALDIAFQGDAVYFESASAALTPEFRQLLTAIAPVLKQSPDAIEVEGFTNDLPLHSTEYATAWELSSARATNVVRFLAEDCGVPPHQLEAIAMGQWHPLYANDSASNLALNRSVHIVVTSTPPVGLNEGGSDVAPPGRGV